MIRVRPGSAILFIRTERMVAARSKPARVLPPEPAMSRRAAAARMRLAFLSQCGLVALSDVASSR